MPVALEDWRRCIGSFLPESDRSKKNECRGKSRHADEENRKPLFEPKTDCRMSAYFSNNIFIDLRRLSRTAGLMCLFILAGFLLLLAHDVETNPGPHTSDVNHGISDGTLLEVAQAISSETHIRKLGMELGLKWPDIDRFIQTNRMGGRVTYEGTVLMLNEWKQGVRSQFQAERLQHALEKAGLSEVAERLITSSLSSSSPSLSSLSMETGGEQGMDSKATQAEHGIIERCRENIISYFRIHLCRIKTDPFDFNTYVDFDSLYTNLSLLEENGKVKAPLEYKDLLSLTINGRAAKRLMIQGEAGAGKTTLCSKIAWDWVSGVGFQHYKLVVVFQLRYYENSMTVGQMIKEYYVQDNNPATAEQIDNYCIANQDKVLLLFDGLDEFSGDLSNESRKDIIVQIIRSSKFCSTTAIVTTRPWKADEIRGNLDIRQAFRFVEVQGFKREDVATYVRKFFSFRTTDAPQAENLVSFVDENDIISRHMAPFPIYVSMLCVMWSDLPQERLDGIRKLQTFAEIFDTMIWFLRDHFITKGIKRIQDIKQSTTDDIEECQRQIGELALHGLLKKKFAFVCDDFKGCESAREFGCRLGILSQEEEIVPGRNRLKGAKRSTVHRTSITFPHKLFQEFMAGLYLSSLFETEHDAFVSYIQESVIPRAEEFRYLLYFLTAQEEDVGMDVLKRLCNTSEMKSEKLDFIADVVFECHNKKAASLVEEFLLLADKGEELPKYYLLPHTLAGYLFSLNHLVKLSIFRNSYGINGSRVLADAVCSIATLESLALQRSVLHAEFYQRVAADAKSSKIRHLEWEEQDLRDDSVASERAAEWISSMPHLTTLILGDTKFHDAFFRRVAKNGFPLKICHLQFKKLKAGDKPSRDIAEWISLMPLLTRLELNEVDFHADFYRLASLKTKASKISSMKICKAQLSDATTSCYAAKWICALEHLTNLKLEGIDEFSDSIFSHMAPFAAFLNVNVFRLKDLYLVNEESSTSLATLIYSMPYLTHLKIEQARFHEVFFDGLAKNARSMKLDTLEIKRMPPFYRQKTNDRVSQRAADWISSMPSLMSIRLYLPSFHEAFTAQLSSRATDSGITTQTHPGEQCSRPKIQQKIGDIS